MSKAAEQQAFQPAEGERERLAALLGEAAGLEVYPRSIVAAGGKIFFLGRQGEGGWDQKRLGVLGDGPAHGFAGGSAEAEVDGEAFTLTTAELAPENAAALRREAPAFAPRALGLAKSIGCGDRLGLATPGHIRSLRRHTGPDGQAPMAPIFAQQSIRENARTGRTPQNVIDDATWGVLQEGWLDGYGADADHLKTLKDVESCAAAGFTFFTIDPGDYVDDGAETAQGAALEAKVAALEWDLLESDPQDLRRRLADRVVHLQNGRVYISQEELLRAAAKYGGAVAHTVRLYRHLESVSGGRPFELEISVDETDSVTSVAEHIYIATELKRLAVRWVSLAPRYVGRFEKGVDYIGDLDEFERHFAAHFDVAQTFGPYKLSLHSGSDKFSVYPIAARIAGGFIHLKTAGTSYLEALRVVAQHNPALFRSMLAFGLERYDTDRATYHVSAEKARVPGAGGLADDALEGLLDDFHARQVFHVTFGSVLAEPNLRDGLFKTLRSHEEAYAECLENHFSKHIAPFAG